MRCPHITDAEPAEANPALWLLWQQACHWLCHSRRRHPANADIWHLRWHWPTEEKSLFQRVMDGRYRLSPMLITGRGQDARAIWSASDALVLKWVALRVQDILPQHPACMHLTDGGVMKSVGKVADALACGEYRFVHCTDIRGYYAHIRKQQVMAQVRQWVTDPVLQGLMEQYVNYSVERGGEIHTPQNGIPRGCSLSPLIGGSLLRHIDSHWPVRPGENYCYVRYMDDFLLLARTRWQLRRGIACLASDFDTGGFARHPEKTQTGRVERGFDWLGIWFGPEGPSLSPRAIKNHRERRLRLYEQMRSRGASPEETDARVQAYVSRWMTWGNRLLQAASRMMT